MWTEERILSYLKNNLKEKRVIHSIGVSETAIKLAEIYGVDVLKAKISGLLHDCAKYMTNEEIMDIMKGYGHTIDKVVLENPSLMHGLASAHVAQKIMDINDEEILSAVRYHTTGKANMTILEKIIYLADFIEPSREYEGVEMLRKESFRDLDKALLMAFDNTIRFVISKGQLLHIDTVEARNYLIYKK